MYRRSFRRSYFDKNTILTAAIVMTWVAGLSMGICADRFNVEAIQACLLLAPYQIPGFWGMMCIAFLPLLISVYAVSFFRPLVFGVCFLRALMIGSGLSSMARLYADAACMMSGFLLFTLLWSGPVLIWYWISSLAVEGELRKYTIISFFLLGIVCCLDRYGIAPLLREIMNF